MSIDRYRRYILIGAEIDTYILSDEKYDKCHEYTYNTEEGEIAHIRSSDQYVTIGIPLQIDRGLKDYQQYTEFTAEQCKEYAEKVKEYLKEEFEIDAVPGLFLLSYYD